MDIIYTRHWVRVFHLDAGNVLHGLCTLGKILILTEDRFVLGAEVFVVDVVDVNGAAFGRPARGRLVATDLFLLLATLFPPFGASVFKPNLITTSNVNHQVIIHSFSTKSAT